jgi:Phosphate-induced protein 1 conserved region
MKVYDSGWSRVVTSRADLQSLVLAVIMVFAAVSQTQAGKTRNPTHLIPTGKGWGERRSHRPSTVRKGNGIWYHGGPVMPRAVKVYFIWYGNWTNGLRASDSQMTIDLLDALFAPGGAASGGIGGSDYARINSTYGDNRDNMVTGNIALAESTTDNYSQGKWLSDPQVKQVVSDAIGATLPNDRNGIYFVLTSSDVAENSGFCDSYCGWHDHAFLFGRDIKYAFVGNPDRCPAACEAQTITPNGDSGADGMAPILAHEALEMLNDPDLNAWYDSNGLESADKCEWKFGPTIGSIGNGAYTQVFANGTKWLLELNWENSRGGGCDQTLGGDFYSN